MGTLGVALALLLAACGAKETGVAAKPAAFNPDSHLFLEEIEGKQALDWVKGENERTLKVLESEPRYQGYYDEALKIATSKERIPYGSLRNGYVYNYWQDGEHVRGLWRRVRLTDYAKSDPPWETILDVDALAKSENANWVYKGVSCLPPAYERCIVELSDGGKDAVRLREFDVVTKSFVAGGFDIPEAKSDMTWKDIDTLLVSTDWGDEAGKPTLTTSGYPFVIKELKRGQSLKDATEVARGKESDVAASAYSIEDAEGRRWFGAVEALTFFTTAYSIFPDHGGPAITVPLPPKATIHGVFADTLLVTLEQDWTPDGQDAFKTGDLIGFSWSQFLKDGKLPKVDLVLRPTALQAVQDISIAKDAVLVTLSNNVALDVLSYTKAGGRWASKKVPLPEKGSASVTYADENETTAFLGYESYLEPDALYQYDTASGAMLKIKSLPAWFDAEPYVTEQFESTSTDGTKIPYFVVRKKTTKLDGNNPTLLYAYGGFQVSQTPSYSGTVGKLWLEQGGVYVVANIRGGGEFGPAWHEAGLKTHRQIVFDDFISVAEDLIARKITSPSKLGAMGGSNGGLLMGVMFVQRPDLFKAIVCQVPLLDMLRFNKLGAGASWMDEYGNPDDPAHPEERAFLEKISPYHNVKPDVDYPEIYIETSTKDDRVHPAHARKMAKRLEELGKPFFYYENTEGGHSAAANQQETAHRIALEFTYLARKLMDSK
ncbi:MAG: prolyl oligopeptidase family serine peptidase [Alphaproteobacteria bacterium]|nr:prolyl oligopeptidase family serine peptidase [Alphaproteobacteria bacterium]